MSIWAIPVLGAAALHYLLVTRARGFFTGDGIFVASQLLMVTGTLTITSSSPLDQKYVAVVATPFLVYCAASIFAHVTRPIVATRVIVEIAPLKAPEVLLAMFSVMVVVAYFVAVGYSTLLVGVNALVTGEDADLATLRVDSYSGSRYLAPGYVNQFKNVILPALAVIGAVVLFRRKSPLALPWTLVLGGAALVGVLGTGQRGAFVLVALVLITTLRHSSVGGSFVRRLIPALVLVLGIMMVATLVLGRSSDDLSRKETVGGQSGVLLGELWQRVTGDNQLSGLAAFRYTESIPPGMGRDWYEGILGLTPFHRGSPLAGEVFKTLYGSDRGTSPPSIWGSVYYNFGYLGLLLVPMILVVINRYTARKFFAEPRRDVLEVVGYSGLFVVVGMWVAGSPDFLFNVGIVAYLLLIWLGGKRRKRSQPAQDHGSDSRAAWSG